MITIKEAVELIRNNQPGYKVADYDLSNCLNKVTAEEIISPEPLPGFTNSAMDGYAVRWDDVKILQEKNSIKLKIVGESQAGIPFHGIIKPLEVIKINTGALLPDNLDTIIPVEQTEEIDNYVLIKAISKKGNHVRYQGEELTAGDVLIKKGVRINAGVISLIASVGITKIKCFKTPNIGIITTGSELIPVGDLPRLGQIRNSNKIMLENAVTYSGGSISFSESVSDDYSELLKKLDLAEKNSDIIIISGGVSVGEHDLVKEAAVELNFDQLFWKVKQKPGKPLFVAKKNEKILFGLPGNPVSSLNCYTYYIHPVILNMLGLKFSWKKIKGKFYGDYINTENRANFLRVQLEKKEDDCFKVIKLEKQGSNMISSIAIADGFVIVEESGSVSHDQLIDVFLYPWIDK